MDEVPEPQSIAMLAQPVRERTSSIELQRSRDGTYYWSIKVYFDASDQYARQAAQIQVTEADNWLKGRYLPQE